MGIIIFTASDAFGLFQILPLVVAEIFIARSSQWVEEAIATYKVAKLASERAEAIREFENKAYHIDYTYDDTPNPMQDELDEMLTKWDKENIDYGT